MLFKINELNHKNAQQLVVINQVNSTHDQFHSKLLVFLGPSAKKLKGDGPTGKGSANGNGVKAKGKKAKSKTTVGATWD